MDRRELFSFLSSAIQEEGTQKQSNALRPPYYSTQDDFIGVCTHCDAPCIEACGENILLLGDDKIPYVDFSQSGCTYCDECARACEPQVLNLEYKAFIAAEVQINTSQCMSWSGVMCFSCKDPCLEDAIEFKAMFMPTIEQEKCTSCGFCVSRCPSFAIDIKVIS